MPDNMDQLHTVLSPIFPPEKDIDVPADFTPLTHSGSVQVFIKLVEPVVFLQGFEPSSKHSSKSDTDLKQPSIMRGALIVRVQKPTKLKSIALDFKGICRTEWPEGIPPKKHEFVETNDIINHVWPFYQHDHQKYIPVTSSLSDSDKTALHIDYLLKNSGAAMYRAPVKNNTNLHEFSLSPVSSNTNIPPSPSILSTATTLTNRMSNSVTPTVNATATTPIKNKDNRQSRARNSSVSAVASPKSQPIRSLSPLSLFRKSSITNNEPQTSTKQQIINNNNTTTTNNINTPNQTNIKTLNHPPTSNSIFADLFGFSTAPTKPSTSANNVSISTSTNYNSNASSNLSRRLSNVSTLNNRRSSIPNIDTITLSNNNQSENNSIGDSPLCSTSNNIDDTQFTKSTDPHDSFIFETGDYIYTFEQIISQNYPESIKADYGYAEYHLLATVERYGAFKSNLVARLPVTIIRTPSDNSVEESEPIVISRDWENYLYYDILIASKDIILDAFLPIHFTFSPLDKVTLHRIRIYVTETMEYYCKNKKVHRMEPTKKFLLAEHSGPKLPNAPKDNKPLKAKYMGNLLEEDGFLVNKDFELQVFIPSRFGNSQQLHPDTGFENIKSSHWIKICLRLSKVVDNKRKHYEISIDSPIHVLNKLCSHANILLPSYDSHLLANNNFNVNTLQSVSNANVLASEENIYHNSNIFFPKEILMSPLVSPEVKPLDINLNSPPTSPLPRSVKSMIVNNNGSSLSINKGPTRNLQGIKNSLNDPQLFKSPKLRSNIYQPESLQRELASPQAMPLSPVTSPHLRPKSLQVMSDIISLQSMDESDPPPTFDSIFGKFITVNDKMPVNPPTYYDTLKSNATDTKRMSLINSNTRNLNNRIPKIFLNKSQESLLSNTATDANIDNELENSFTSNDNDTDVSDIASGFSFQGSLAQSFSPNVKPMASRNKSINMMDSPRYTRRGSIQDNLPSTVRMDNSMFGDLSQILSDHSDEDTKTSTANTPIANSPAYNSPQSSPRNIQDISTTLDIHDDHNLKPSSSNMSSGGNLSARSSLDTSAVYLQANGSTMEPLLHAETSGTLGNRTVNESFLQSLDSMNEYVEEPIIDSAVDITALYDRNAAGWLPLQLTNHFHSDIPAAQLKSEHSGGTRESSSPTESPGLEDELSSGRISRMNENNEPKHVLDIETENHLSKRLNESLS